jgi:hypothetical protein
MLLGDSVRGGKHQKNTVNQSVFILDKALADVRLNIWVNEKQSQPEPTQRTPTMAMEVKTNVCLVHLITPSPRMSLRE